LASTRPKTNEKKGWAPIGGWRARIKSTMKSFNMLNNNTKTKKQKENNEDHHSNDLNLDIICKNKPPQICSYAFVNKLTFLFFFFLYQFLRPVKKKKKKRESYG
jgi:hypothetical protein